MLNAADNQIKALKKRGMSGQNRDFAPGIEANRIALVANDEDYGFKLNMCKDIILFRIHQIMNISFLILTG